jgi:hypothetical protein
VDSPSIDIGVTQKRRYETTKWALRRAGTAMDGKSGTGRYAMLKRLT